MLVASGTVLYGNRIWTRRRLLKYPRIGEVHLVNLTFGLKSITFSQSCDCVLEQRPAVKTLWVCGQIWGYSSLMSILTSYKCWHTIKECLISSWLISSILTHFILMEVGVENLGEGEERRLCSLKVAPGLGQYQCRLNLGQEKYCDQVTQDTLLLILLTICQHRGLHSGWRR